MTESIFTKPSDGLPEVGEYTLIYVAGHPTCDEGSKFFVSRFEGREVYGNDKVPYGWRGPGPFSFFGWQVTGWLGMGFAYPLIEAVSKDRGSDPPQAETK